MLMTEIAPERVNFSMNVNGPWPRTGQDAFAVQLEVLFSRLRAITDQPAASYSIAEQFTLGVKDAAAWTLGVTAKAPFRPGETAVSDAAVNRCLGDAELLVQTGTIVERYAAGVRAWLRWLAALNDVVEYPEG